jgi:hypothetical protein
MAYTDEDLTRAAFEGVFPDFDDWTREEVDKFFSQVEDMSIAAVIRQRIQDNSPDIPLETVAAKFGIDLDALGEEPPRNKAGFRIPD